MLHFPAARDGTGFDPDQFWNSHAIAFLGGIGCDGRVGRHSPALLQAAGYLDVAMDYVVVDTLRVPRDVFADIISAWRDGYAPSLSEASGHTEAAVIADFDRMIAAIQTPPQYAVWQVPVASGRKGGPD